LIKSKYLDKEKDKKILNNILGLLKQNLDIEVLDVSEDIINSFLYKKKSLSDNNNCNQEVEILLNNISRDFVIILWFCCDKDELEYFNELIIKFDHSFEERLFIEDNKNNLTTSLKSIFFD
jgi:hypothetical protein